MTLKERATSAIDQLMIEENDTPTECALAALAAIAEPSEAMIEKGLDAMVETGNPAYVWKWMYAAMMAEKDKRMGALGGSGPKARIQEDQILTGQKAILVAIISHYGMIGRERAMDIIDGIFAEGFYVVGPDKISMTCKELK